MRPKVDEVDGKGIGYSGQGATQKNENNLNVGVSTLATSNLFRHYCLHDLIDRRFAVRANYFQNLSSPGMYT